MFDVEAEGPDGDVRWSALECARVRLSQAQIGHKLDTLNSRFTFGTLRQQPSYASITTSTPNVKLTNLHGPGPIDDFLASSLCRMDEAQKRSMEFRLRGEAAPPRPFPPSFEIAEAAPGFVKQDPKGSDVPE